MHYARVRRCPACVMDECTVMGGIKGSLLENSTRSRRVLGIHSGPQTSRHCDMVNHVRIYKKRIVVKWYLSVHGQYARDAKGAPWQEHPPPSALPPTQALFRPPRETGFS